MRRSVQRHCYLGDKPLPRAQPRYFAYAADGLLLAPLCRGAAAWTTSPRDPSVDWDRTTRERDLPSVVKHAHYLILQWIRLSRLASHLHHPWQGRCRIRPSLLESRCETTRSAGICGAATRIDQGQALRQGKLDTRHECAKPLKNFFVKPLCPEWKAIPNRSDRRLPTARRTVTYPL